MRQSKLSTKTIKGNSSKASSINNDLLLRGGFVDQTSAGVYSFLPLGVVTLANISAIVRDEMEAIGGLEVFLPALHPKENWEQTKRWDTVDILFKINSQTGFEYALGPTHEEIIAPLAKKHINSYRDLPFAWYQIQTKFRDELRAKAGLLRGREFLMKDMYSFHSNQEDLKNFYESVKIAYKKIFTRCGLNAIVAEASGGSFSKDFSHEFQVETESGEDVIFKCECGFAQNKEIAKVKKGDNCPLCNKKIEEVKTIEVGNIFDLGTKFSEDFGLVYCDSKGDEQKVVIGCYGIGISRLMGAIVEVNHDEKGIIWPEEVSPYKYHLLTLSSEKSVIEKSEKVYNIIKKNGDEILWDDRECTNGEKFSDSDLIGIPNRLIISPKTEDKIEYKNRKQEKSKLINLEEILECIVS
jgi:prolyl-tRNA synthetase